MLVLTMTYNVYILHRLQNTFLVKKSTYIAICQALGSFTDWLTCWLAWPHNGIVLENTKIEFPGFYINVPRIFYVPFLSVRHVNPFSPVSPPVRQSVSPPVRQSVSPSIGICNPFLNLDLIFLTSPYVWSKFNLPDMFVL